MTRNQYNETFNVTACENPTCGHVFEEKEPKGVLLYPTRKVYCIKCYHKQKEELDNAQKG